MVIETRYFRSDMWDATYYKLLTANTGVTTTLSALARPESGLGIKVYKNGNAPADCISGAVPVARVNAPPGPPPFEIDGTWLCPATAGVNFLVVEVWECNSLDGSNAQLICKFKTDVFNGDLLNVIWTVHYWCFSIFDPITGLYDVYFLFGSALRNSRITNFQYTLIIVSEPIMNGFMYID